MNSFEWLIDINKNNKGKLYEIINNSLALNLNNELKTVYLFLTRKCNLGCSHCYISGVGPKAIGVDFNLEKICEILSQAKSLGLKRIKVSGGEPFLHNEIIDILEFIESLELDEVVLETNGTLINDDKFNKLKNIKNLTIFVSLDHINQSEHDSFRNKEGAYKKTIEFLKKLGSTNINSVVTTTAYKDNFNIIHKIIDFILETGIKKHRTLLNIHPLGNALKNTSNALTIDECINLISEIINSDYYKKGKAYLTIPPALTPIEDLKKISTCGWGDKVIGVLSSGEISMCSASYDDPKMIAGNINEDSLSNIWESGFFEELREIGNGKVKGVCGNCILYSVCRGVCKMSSYGHYGEKDAPYPLCQEFYNNGLFPEYALADPDLDCTYKPNTIPLRRN